MKPFPLSQARLALLHSHDFCKQRGHPIAQVKPASLSTCFRLLYDKLLHAHKPVGPSHGPAFFFVWLSYPMYLPAANITTVATSQLLLATPPSSAANLPTCSATPPSSTSPARPHAKLTSLRDSLSFYLHSALHSSYSLQPRFAPEIAHKTPLDGSYVPSCRLPCQDSYHLQKTQQLLPNGRQLVPVSSLHLEPNNNSSIPCFMHLPTAV